MLVNTIALREAKTSTGIENIFTTDNELYKALSGNEVALNPNTKEVLRYRQAIWVGYQNVQKRGVIDIDLIVKIYQEIKQMRDGFDLHKLKQQLKSEIAGY